MSSRYFALTLSMVMVCACERPPANQPALDESGRQARIESLLQQLRKWDALGDSYPEALPGMQLAIARRLIFRVTQSTTETSNQRLRRTAREDLDRLGATNEQLMRGYAAALNSSNAIVRREAVAALVPLGSDVHTKLSLFVALGDSLASSDAHVRDAARSVLDSVHATNAQRIQSYRGALDRGSSQARREAINVLSAIMGSSDAPDIVEVFREALTDWDPSVAGAARDVLQKAGLSDPDIVTLSHEQILKKYLTLIESKHLTSDDRAAAASALARLNDATAIPHLLNLLGDDRGRVDTSVRHALRTLGASNAQIVDRYLDILERTDGGYRARENAAAMVGRLGDDSAIPRVSKLEEFNPAHSALQQLRLTPMQRATRFISVLEERVSFRSEDDRAVAREALDELGNRSEAVRARMERRARDRVGTSAR